ncbi:MAG: hypothetical protein HOI35_17730 [Woeseia sp.]|jgi:hypothetical protein|nr:hypothetical protein [Woeseia sp.]MBT6211844.1 hypothetical protein [Woeseia sp.]
MKAVRIRYEVEASFVDRNTTNLRSFMDALRRNPIEGLSFVAFVLDDKRTFVHVIIERDNTARGKMSAMPEFRTLQTELEENCPASSPSSNDLNFIDASYDF